ncbi:fatty acid desaturase [soil metagenome]
MKPLKKHRGELIAISIILLWSVVLLFHLHYPVHFFDPFIYLFILIQTHLYTGLFITAHDAMHGVVSKNKKLNKIIGSIAALLFAYNFYFRLFPKHHEHHKFVASDKDPDYHDGHFIIWYFNFLKQYITWYQLALMALTYHILILFFPTANVIFFWIIPSILATLQLFYFGTYLPHRGNHAPENKHKSSSLQKNHFLAFIYCYFFGYHYEHHNAPSVPWWQLYKEKK